MTAGRDTDNLAFERQHAVEHVQLTTGAVPTAQVRLTVLDPKYVPVADAIMVDSPIGLKCCSVIARSEADSG